MDLLPAPDGVQAEDVVGQVRLYSPASQTSINLLEVDQQSSLVFLLRWTIFPLGWATFPLSGNWGDFDVYSEFAQSIMFFFVLILLIIKLKFVHELCILK